MIDRRVSCRERPPNSKHSSIVGNVHPRSTIEHIRTVLIRELYERTSDPHTEWLKCKMSIPRSYINPKYYADFQRRYKHEIRRQMMKKKKVNTDDGYNALHLIKTNDSSKSSNTSVDIGKRQHIVVRSQSIVILRTIEVARI
jgi:hypothetical protein